MCIEACEKATIVANGYRFRVPYGTLLCVSDRPLRGKKRRNGIRLHLFDSRMRKSMA